MSITVELPIRVVSESNVSCHWATRAKRAKKHRSAAKLLVKSAITEPLIVITLTRIAPRRLDDGNLGISMKAVQDGVADALRIDDGSVAVRWLYNQRRGAMKEYAVLVEIGREDGK